MKAAKSPALPAYFGAMLVWAGLRTAGGDTVRAMVSTLAAIESEILRHCPQARIARHGDSGFVR